VPDAVISKALIEAVNRGVKTRIIPGEIIDTDTLCAAARGIWGPLLQAGAEIHE